MTGNVIKFLPITTGRNKIVLFYKSIAVQFEGHRWPLNSIKFNTLDTQYIRINLVNYFRRGTYLVQTLISEEILGQIQQQIDVSILRHQ